MTEGTLVVSSHSGRYAIDDPEDGQDLTSGQPVEICLGGLWISGSIEHAGRLYAIESLQPQRGYYFAADRGEICGLCAGMRVRIPG